MAKKYGYSIRMGAEVDESQIDLSLRKVNNYLKKDKNMAVIQAKFDTEEIDKAVIGVKAVIDKMSGDVIGKSFTMKIGDQFIEIQQNLKGTIKSVELLESSMNRLGGSTEGLDSVNKRIETLRETIRQINTDDSKIINAADISTLNKYVLEIDVLSDTITQLEANITALQTAKKQALSDFDTERKVIEEQDDQLSSAMFSLETRIKETTSNNEKLYQSLQKLEQDKDKLLGVSSFADELGIKGVAKTSSMDLTGLFGDDKSNITQNISDIEKEISKLSQELYDGEQKIISWSDELSEATAEQKKFQEDLSKNYSSDAKDDLNKQLSAEITAEYNLLNDAIQERYQLMNGADVAIKKVANADANYKKEVKELTTSLENLYKQEVKFQSELSKTQRNGTAEDVAYYEEQIALLKQKETVAKRAITIATGDKSIQQEISQKYEQQIAQKREIYTIQQNTSQNQKDLNSDATEYIRIYQQLVTYQKELYKEQQKVANSDIQVSDEQQNHVDYLKQQISLYEKKRAELLQVNPALEENERVIRAINKADDNLALSNSKVTAQFKQQSLTLSDLHDRINDAIWGYNLLDRALDYVIDSIRYSVDQVIELNTAMTDVQMVTGQNQEETLKLAQTYSDMARELGATTTEVAASSSEWLRQGKTIEETNQLIEASMVLSKVGALESAEASEILTSVMNGYKLEVEDAIGVVDSFSAVDLAAATSVAELGTAMQRTANIARESGVEFDTLVGYIATVSETTRRSAETVGESFKTIFSRFTNVKAGVFVDPESGESLNDIEKVLAEVGIALRESENEWRNLEDVIADIAGAWEIYNDKQRNAIATAVAGVRQAENFRALMSNYERSVELAGVSLDSSGMAMEKFEIYTESLQASLNELKAAWDSLIYNEDTVKFFTAVIDIATKLIDTLKILNTNNNLVWIVGGALITSKITDLIINGQKYSGVLSGIVQALGMLGKSNRHLIDTARSAAELTDSVDDVAQSLVKADSGAAALALNLKVLAGIAAIAITAMAVDAIFVSYDELAEKVDELSDSYKTIISEVESLNSQLELTHDRMEELSRLGSLSPIEQAEYDRLESTTKLLEKQLEIQQKLAELENKKLIDASDELFSQMREDTTPWDDNTSTNSLMQRYRLATHAAERGTGGAGNIDDALESLLERQGELIQRLGLDGLSEDAVRETQAMLDEIELLIDPESFYNDKVEGAISGLSEEIQKSLAVQAKSGNLTQSDIARYPTLLNLMSEHKLHLSDISNALVMVNTETETTAEETQSLLELYEEFDGKTASVQEALTNLSDGMAPTVSDLKAIVEIYPEMATEVDKYLSGLIDVKTLISSFKNVYQADLLNYQNKVMAKRMLDEDFYESVKDIAVDIAEAHFEGYEIDLENAKNLAEQKLLVEQALFEQLTAMNLECYGIVANNFEQAYGQLLQISHETDQKLTSDQRNLINQYQSYIKAMNDIGKVDIEFDISGNLLSGSGGIGGLDSSSLSDAKDELIDLVVDMLKDELNHKKDALQDELDDLKDAHDKKIELIEEERDATIEAIEDEIDAYNRLIDARLEALQEESDERSYEQELNERSESIADLEKQISELSNDDSSAATQQRLELEEQLAQERLDLENFQYEREKELKEDALEDELERYEEDKEAYIESIEDKYDAQIEALEDAFEATEEDYERRIDALDDQLSREGELRAQAIHLIENDADNLYNRLIEWDSIYGQHGIDTINEIWNAYFGYSQGVINQTQAMTNAVNQYNSALAQSNQLKVQGPQTYEDWLAGGGTFGPWNIGDNNTPNNDPETEFEEYFDGYRFHDGGYVDTPWKKTLFKSIEDGLGADEIYAKLQKGEFVATQQQQQTLADLVTRSADSIGYESSAGFNLGTLMNVVVQGNLDSSVLPDIERIANNVFKELNKSMSSRGVKRNSRMAII